MTRAKGGLDIGPAAVPRLFEVNGKETRGMCHGHIDPRTLMIEAEMRYRAAQPRPDVAQPGDAAPELPPELTGGLKGLWARVRAALAASRPRQAPAR